MEPTSTDPEPRHLPMFPLGTVLFPGARLPLHVFEPRYRALTKDCLASDAMFGIVLIERGSEVGGGDQRTSVGTRVRIAEAGELADGRWLLLVEGVERIRVIEWLPDEPYPWALVEGWPAGAEQVEAASLHTAEQCVRRARGLMAESGSVPGAALSADVTFDEDHEIGIWQLCAEAPLSAFDAQRLLGTEGTGARLELLAELTAAVEDDLRRMLSAP